MPTAAILSVGDEIIFGQQLDTNSAWLSAALADLGWTVLEHRTVGDERAAIVAALRELGGRCGAVISTGGLGPTLDDLTREALGDVTDPGAELVEDPQGLAHLESWFGRRGRRMSPSNRQQALRPRSARLLENGNGTAPGLAAEWRRSAGAGAGRGSTGTCLFFCLPGPPREMRPMFETAVAPRLVEQGGGSVVLSATIPQIGLGESVAAEKLGELMERGRNPSVGTTASGGLVKARIRMTIDPADRGGAAEFQAVVGQVCTLWAPYAFADHDGTLVAALAALLRGRGLTLAVAESCTGGVLGGAIVDLAGSSDFFVGGVIAYSNRLKVSLLGVEPGTIETHGAVSAETAEAMARGACAASGASCALAVTGVAGPAGGSAEKPVGTTFIAAVVAGDVRVRRFCFTGDRRDIRERAATMALQVLRLELVGEGGAPLLWEW